jgi:hypothetical protein
MPVISSIVAAAAVAGVGLSVAGTLTNMSAAAKANAAQKQVIAGEQAAEAQRQKAMELDARRRQLETFRNVQRSRSLALTNATNQGAQQGSGLQGGYGQIAGEGGTNLLGINQGLEVGRDLFSISGQISQAKMRLADAGQQASLGSGLSSLGGSIMNSLGTFSKISSGWGGTTLNYGGINPKGNLGGLY